MFANLQFQEKTLCVTRLGSKVPVKSRALYSEASKNSFLSFLSPPAVATSGHVSAAAVAAAVRPRVFLPLGLVNDRQTRGTGSQSHQGLRKAHFPGIPRKSENLEMLSLFLFFLVLKRKCFRRFILTCELPLEERGCRVVRDPIRAADTIAQLMPEEDKGG